MPDTAAHTGNGDQRVKNAEILAAVKGVQKDVDEIIKTIDRIDCRQRDDHDKLTEHGIAIASNAKEIGLLRTVNRAWDWINSGGAFIAAMIGWFK